MLLSIVTSSRIGIALLGKLLRDYMRPNASQSTWANDFQRGPIEFSGHEKRDYVFFLQKTMFGM